VIFITRRAAVQPALSWLIDPVLQRGHGSALYLGSSDAPVQLVEYGGGQSSGEGAQGYRAEREPGNQKKDARVSDKDPICQGKLHHVVDKGPGNTQAYWADPQEWDANGDPVEQADYADTRAAAAEAQGEPRRKKGPHDEGGHYRPQEGDGQSRAKTVAEQDDEGDDIGQAEAEPRYGVGQHRFGKLQDGGRGDPYRQPFRGQMAFSAGIFSTMASPALGPITMGAVATPSARTQGPASTEALTTPLVTG
jgi:hypothetical protein